MLKSKREIEEALSLLINYHSDVKMVCYIKKGMSFRVARKLFGMTKAKYDEIKTNKTC